jgi:hypothetical protein
MPSGRREFGIVCGSGEYNGNSCVVLGGVLREPDFIREVLVTSTLEVVGDVRHLDALIGDEVQMSTRVRVGDVWVFTPSRSICRLRL